jgi:hypothetical protein
MPVLAILHIYGELYNWQIALIYVTTFNSYMKLILKKRQTLFSLASCGADFL